MNQTGASDGSWTNLLGVLTQVTAPPGTYSISYTATFINLAATNSIIALRLLLNGTTEIFGSQVGGSLDPRISDVQALSKTFLVTITGTGNTITLQAFASTAKVAISPVGISSPPQIVLSVHLSKLLV